jgi:ubiquinone/menaquinone biosynthesis C-methylase UbiE
LDLILIPNVFFQSEDKKAIMSEAERVLKNEGELIVIEWLPQASQGPVEGRISAEEMKELAEEAGFKMKKEISAGKYHYGLVFKKP